MFRLGILKRYLSDLVYVENWVVLICDVSGIAVHCPVSIWGKIWFHGFEIAHQLDLLLCDRFKLISCSDLHFWRTCRGYNICVLGDWIWVVWVDAAGGWAGSQQTQHRGGNSSRAWCGCFWLRGKICRKKFHKMHQVVTNFLQHSKLLLKQCC